MNMGDKELSLIDSNVTSLLDVHLNPTVTSLILHCNRIPRIEGLTSAWHLRHLDLSSNLISKIEGLSSLTSLRTLNLSCNSIITVEGLNGLVNLTRLNLSYNQINDLSGLLYLHGPEYKLKHLSLHSNHLDNIDHLLQCLLGIQCLREVTLSQDGRNNPICRSPGYREIVFESLPQISALDGLDLQGNPSFPLRHSPLNIPGLEDYVDLLFTSDTSHSEVDKGGGPITTPRIDQVLTHFRRQADPPSHPPHIQHVPPAAAAPAEAGNEKRIRRLEHQVCQLIQQAPAGGKADPSTALVRKAKRDTDHTSESECDSGKENRMRSRIPKHQQCVTSSTTTKETKSGKSDSDLESRKQKTSKSAVGLRRKVGGSASVWAAEPTKTGPLRAAKALGEVRTRSTEEEETYRTIVEERDQERERRWKAEQAVRKLTEELKFLQTKVSEEKDVQTMALHTTDRLKDQLLKERSDCTELQARVKELEGRCCVLTQQLERANSKEEQQRATLRQLEDSVSHAKAFNARQQAEEMKCQQEQQNKVSALRRELDIQRASVHQHKEKMQQLHELLASREQEHRKELELRLKPGWVDFQEAVAKDVASLEQRHSQREAELQEKLAEGRKQYAALEDEFRMALTIEAARFSEVKEACDQMTAELLELQNVVAQSQQREKKSGSQVQELTAMVKEQKSRISDLLKQKKDAMAERKRERTQLLSQLTAQESVMNGLRAEKRMWSQELAQQGASLAQDRGRLEARIEALSSELESQKKQNERDKDALKIKSRIIDDQTETIRKLKETQRDREDQIIRLREEAAQAQKRSQQLLEEETAQNFELKEQVERLSVRKEELKQQLEDIKRAHSDSSKEWQEKADILARLESQVMRMKESFEAKERSLLEDRERETLAHRTVVEKLRCVDDAFRRQLEAVQTEHQAELLQMATESQRTMEQANQKVREVEEEMRQLLQETDDNKRIMEEKMNRLSRFLTEFKR